MKKAHRCTIITPLLKSDSSILETFHSLKNQLNPDICWLIKNSEEDSSGILDFARGRANILYIEQRDTCLYDAINQALSAIESEFYVVIGAGDKIADSGVSVLSSFIDNAKGIDGLFFAASRYPDNLIYSPRPELLQSFMSTPHPGSVLRTELSKRLGGYDTRYKIASDYDHLSKYVKHFPTCGKSDFILTHYMGGGISETRLLEGYLETCLVRMRVWNESQDMTAYSIFKALEGSYGKL